METFKPRLSKPEAGNKYYNTTSNKGLNKAIKGKPTDAGCNVLSNCVGYSNGRFAEVMGEFKYQFISNAENFVSKAKKLGLEVGQTPRLGAIICWEGIGSKAGHVANVEQINSDGTIITSESGYNSKAFWTTKRKKGSGNWGQNSKYKFLGFIYNPKNFCEPQTYQGTIPKLKNGLFAWKRGDKNVNVGYIQQFLNWYYNCNLAVDNSFGPKTETQVKKFQKEMNITVDGKFGPKTISKMKSVKK